MWHRPTTLFVQPGIDFIDPAPDGRRFLVLMDNPVELAREIHVVLHALQ